ncbi:sulfite exporter TauE/SafE family protein [Pseudomaricurvus alkylphenolicus]|uniref:sulfite exporter TauE/SafE family protein n=1 Tax=Pseudomaricurvus alkylphenolicus TaxID=1306991 RepID=UPI00142364BA|nr:sulfite exporter TauE/SafE family protein [Pseudomaricurvus alkylphenolicus]NIB43491.1 sulfite exporter TauE/SafE family protein [Pseudomaricurvus alkylphenolicus]
MEFTLDHYLLLLGGSALATLAGSLLGVGGGFIILGILSALLPTTTLVPVLAVVLACIDVSRTLAFRHHIHTETIRSFVPGSIVGVIAGSLLFVSLSEKVIGTGLSLLILATLLTPVNRLQWKIRYPFYWVGKLHAFLSTLFGYGGLFQATMMRTPLSNQQITATLASCFLALELMKITSYSLLGFNYGPYLGIILVTACGAIPASYVGRQLAGAVNASVYRLAYKCIVCVIVGNILWRVWS